MRDTGCNGIHDVRYLLHVGYQLSVRALYFFNGIIYNLNVIAQLHGIRSNLIYVISGLRYFFQSDLDQL